jgi:class 3 adenylate cyclase
VREAEPGRLPFLQRLGGAVQAAAIAERVAEPRSYTPKHLAEKILTSRSALEGERKHVTVLFADVKGSLELAEQLDPEEWHAILDKFFAILSEGVHRFEGTVNQYTGDGIMALFGAPIAHEDHAQRACYAALYLRDGLRDLARDVRRRHGVILPPASGSTRAKSSSARSATTCAWTTQLRGTPSGSPSEWRIWHRAAAST